MSEDRVERLLGLGPVEKKRSVPGAVDVPGREFRYIADDGVGDFPRLFQRITTHQSGRPAKSGGAISENCKLWLPDGSLFHALSYKGDVDGWRQVIEDGARALNLRLARIVSDMIVVSDGQAASLADCRIEFY